MKLEAGQIARADYCGSALPNAQSIVTGYESKMRIGQRTVEDLIDVKTKMYELKTFCQKS